MTEYETLLNEVLEKIEKFRLTTAREYIPKMYFALRKENPSLTAEDARNRIEKDCLPRVWTHRTKLDALPDEAKNAIRQEAARSRHKKKNFAAMTAANLAVKEKKKILIDLAGKPVEDEKENENDIIPDEYMSVVFCLHADDVWDHLMEHHYLGGHKEPRLWINGSIIKETSEVISTSIGCHRIIQ